MWFWTGRVLVGLIMVGLVVLITFLLTVGHTMWCHWRGKKRQQLIPEQDRCWTCRGTGIGSFEPLCPSCLGSGKKRYLR
jgi:hypothetical protein